MDTELKARDLSKIELQEYYLDLKKVLDEIDKNNFLLKKPDKADEYFFAIGEEYQKQILLNFQKFDIEFLEFFLSKLRNDVDWEDIFYIHVEKIISKLVSEKEHISKNFEQININFRLSKQCSEKLRFIEENATKNFNLNNKHIDLYKLINSNNKSSLPKNLLENCIDYIFYKYRNKKDFDLLVKIIFDKEFNFNFDNDKFTYSGESREEYLLSKKLKWKKSIIEIASFRLNTSKELLMKMFDEAEQSATKLRNLENEKIKLGFDKEKLSEIDKFRSALFDEDFSITEDNSDQDLNVFK